MTTWAFLLVLLSAVFHATWNFFLKQSTHKTAFLWSLTSVSFAVFLIPAVVATAIGGLTWQGAAFGLGSAVIHGCYGFALARGYQLGDLSSVYPVSRGVGPSLIPIAAVLLLDETVSAGAAAGIAFVVIGIYVIHVESWALRDILQPLNALRRPATRVALLTGCFITAYSLWDKQALDHLSPLVLNQFSLLGYLLMLPPLAFAERGRPLRAEWRERRRSVIVAGICAPLAYVMVLVALTASRVSYVAPVREVGIVLGALAGVLFLGEGFGGARIGGSALIVAGVLAIGISP
ncbi:MAG: DMT family transporter [Dehalococcoidia bacterium]